MRIIKYLFIFTGSILLFLFTGTVVASIFNIGNVVGIIFSLVLLLSGLFLEQIISYAKKICKIKPWKYVFFALSSVILSILLSFTAALVSTICASSSNATNNETVIVLGCAVYGETPSSMLSSRVETAVEYMKINPDSVAILSGGQGKGENISEAECMKRILLKKGISENRIYIEDKSTNTTENIKFSKDIIEKYNLSRDVVIATSDFHLKRATMIAKKNNLNAQRLSSETQGFSLPVFYVRDTLGVIKEFIFK